jgi:cell fate regulator YaaT (PSP1 superfamily)
MGCGSCGIGGCSSGGCKKGGCATGGCNKLNTYDWLGNMLEPDQREHNNIYEVRFKGTRKAFYRNVHGLRLVIGDYVAVESDRGYDVGALSLGGVLAELQMRKKGMNVSQERELPKIFRKANENDIASLKAGRAREQETLVHARNIIRDLKLNMKLSEVEYQGDNAKAIFYYIADHRVDFRELIKLLAREFKIRVEMKQIGLRHEAALVGGIGSCGRELCCSTWLTEFRTVNTAAARYQNLSLNPMKISGQCGRLKCCLNYELDAYFDALEGFPEVRQIQTSKGVASLQKTDIFRKTMWFSYMGDNTWFSLDTEQVKQIVEANAKGEKPDIQGVKTMLATLDVSGEAVADFVDVVGVDVPEEESRNRRSKKKKKRPANRSQQQGNPQQRPAEGRPQRPPQEGRENQQQNRPPRVQGPRRQPQDQQKRQQDGEQAQAQAGQPRSGGDGRRKDNRRGGKRRNNSNNSQKPQNPPAQA